MASPKVDRSRAAAIAIEKWCEGASPKEIATFFRGMGLVVEVPAILVCIRAHISAMDEAKFYGKGKSHEDERKRPRAADPA